MRIVFINLHQNEFMLIPLSKLLFKQSIALKHKYFLDYLLSKNDIEVCCYVNKAGGSFSHLPIIGNLFKLLRFWEYKYILSKNKIEKKHITLIKRITDIHQDDIVIGYRHIPSSLSDMDQIPAFKAVSMIHFHGDQKDSDLIRNANPDVLFNESDLKKYSKIFKKYYSWYQGDFIVHPFVAASRFKRIKPFVKREARCFSTGTITYKYHKEWKDVYGDPCDQPTRKQILVNKKTLEPFVACYNSDYLEDSGMKRISPSDNRLIRLYKAYYNLTHVGKQKKYFSFDMVERFNNFKMCLLGEEILGVPGIGFVEGMACGCAYFGQPIGYYEDYGMEAGIHYIAYDGTLPDLKRKIEYYQKSDNQKELEAIANNGYEFACKYFTKEYAAASLLKRLISCQQQKLTKCNL